MAPCSNVFHTGGGSIGWFDNGDHVTYDSLNFQSVQSVCISYAKANHRGKLELMLRNSTGQLVGEFYPSYTGGWDKCKTTCINIKEVEGDHDLTFVAKDTWGVLNLEKFELSDNIELSLATKYKVNDNNGVDINYIWLCKHHVVPSDYTHSRRAIEVLFLDNL